MNYDEERVSLIRYYEENGCPPSRSLSKSQKHTSFVNRVKELYSFLGEMGGKVTIATYITCLLDDIKEPPRCRECDNHVTRVLAEKGQTFPVFCSRSCAAKSDETVRKRKNTCVDRYGVDSPLKSKEILDKVKDTNIKRYGVENVSSSDIIKKKKESVFEERYGTPHYIASKECREKIKNTNLDRYGHEHHSSSKEVKERVKKTNIERYGVGCSLQIPEVREHVLKVWDERYGGHPLKNSEVNKKREETCISRYGVSSFMKSGEFQSLRYSIFGDGLASNTQVKYSEETKRILFNQDLLQEHYDKFHTIKEACVDLDISESTYGRYLSKYGIVVTVGNSSSQEREIARFIQDLGFSVECGVRGEIEGRGEIDILVRDRKLAIEFNGSYFHSTNFRDMLYHQNKTHAIQKAGFSVLHVWEYDWNDPIKKDIILKKITHLLGATHERVAARKTTVVQTDDRTAQDFYTKNHIQGHRKSKYHLGLVDLDGEIVAMMSFIKVPKTKNSYDMTRYATSKSVVGGFTKLLSHFKKNVDCSEIITFASLDYGFGKLYENNGFEKVCKTKPNYKYVGYKTVLSRQQCMKHKLEKLLDVYDPTKSESQNMEDNGYLKVYDCGSIKFRLTV